MRLVFAGTPAFAERALSALAAAGHDIALVLTRPDQPAGRGQQLVASPVKQRAGALGLPVFQPRTLRDPQAQARIAEAGCDAMVVAAYGLILPPAVLALPRLGCLNIHASLLPRWRGAAPIQRAIEAGDTETGITIMQMDAGLDTGPMLSVARLPIGPEESAGSVHDRLAELGATAIVDALARLERGVLVAQPQPAEGVTYAAKLEKSEAALDWRLPAAVLARRVRAFDPFPGCTAVLCPAPGVRLPLKIWQARAVTGGGEPGKVIAVSGDSAVVACGEGALALVALQKPGGKRLPVEAFLRGQPISVGTCFELPEDRAAAPG